MTGPNPECRFHRENERRPSRKNAICEVAQRVNAQRIIPHESPQVVGGAQYSFPQNVSMGLLATCTNLR